MRFKRPAQQATATEPQVKRETRSVLCHSLVVDSTERGCRHCSTWRVRAVLLTCIEGCGLLSHTVLMDNLAQAGYVTMFCKHVLLIDDHMHTSLATLSHDCDIKHTCEIKKNYNPILPSTFRALGWNVGQGTLQTLLQPVRLLRHSRRGPKSAYGGCTGFIQDGGYSKEEPGRSLSHICPGPCAVFSCRCQRGYR